HRVVVINPEIIMDDNSHCEKLWKKAAFTNRLLYMVFNEGHCIKEWSAFREKYKHVGSLCYLIPETVPFFVASATLPDPILQDVSDILQLRPGHTKHILCSNNRPDIALAVQKMQFAVSSFDDLNFLISEDFKNSDPPLQNSSSSSTISRRQKLLSDTCATVFQMLFGIRSSTSIP
ncbi:hypothetical protein BKA93DRAFT_744607, partial [Sparassis latifolia]